AADEMRSSADRRRSSSRRPSLGIRRRAANKNTRPRAGEPEASARADGARRSRRRHGSNASELRRRTSPPPTSLPLAACLDRSRPLPAPDARMATEDLMQRADFLAIPTLLPAQAANAKPRFPMRVAFAIGEGANVIDFAGAWETFQDAALPKDESSA